ncbi:MAG: MarR family transcriptional regulator [Micrococcales bacterium]|nr:MAG: MarR family transcriptional regulator [Micrococcales bacterium]
MTATDASPLSAGTGYRLIKLGEVLFSRAEQALIAFDVRPRHFNVLTTVAADPTLSQRELSGKLGIDPNVMVGVIDELEAAGLARRQRSRSDRRRHIVVVTEAGHRLVAKGNAAVAEAEREFFAQLDRQELRALHATAGRLLGLA